MHYALGVPDSRYLQLHAACAKVVHKSAAAELIDEYLLDYDSPKIL